MLRTGDTFAGYEIKRVLGQGGMGTVYLARHPRLPRLTALKLLARELYTDAEIRGRFEREADLVAQLDHPNIVTVYDRGAEDEQLWISMQFVPGSDAAAADIDVLAPGRAVQIIGEVAAALDFAHANGVLHRDVKPANILLAKAPIGQPERVLLTDFGIAGVRDADTTLASGDTITATLAYAAPEQLSGHTLDHRADQYSLACTLFWLLTGSVPFPGANPAVVLNGHLFGPPPSARALNPALPPALDAVLARAMAKRPADRFASCAEFAGAARHALAVAQRPAGPPIPQAPYLSGPAAGPAYSVPPRPTAPHPAGRPPHLPPGAVPHPGTGGPYPHRPAATGYGPYPIHQPTPPGYGQGRQPTGYPPPGYGHAPGTPPTAPAPGGYTGSAQPGQAQPPGYAVGSPPTGHGQPPGGFAGSQPTGLPPLPGQPGGPQPPGQPAGAGGDPGPGPSVAHPGYSSAPHPTVHAPGPVPGRSPLSGSEHRVQPGPSTGSVDLSRPGHPPTAGPVGAQPPTARPATAAGSAARSSGRSPRPIVIALPDRVRRGRPPAPATGGATGPATGDPRPPP
ncbi:serine/threonine protein kinase [Nocardia farcinica]|uniref:non-specific serine/threonine protein kinase n=2 Tax=Nocardia farcinica TaxID=37329 RepID=A0A0H5P6P2_NOCFR|nr:serine/threonine-protein kinase [Nocardia farcinica]CRY82999.1 Serine/threonine-protein kinase pknF [Nocardia farcinica]SIT26953.1 serine/threonine protein kinase [Nocardia farcinica]